MFTAYTFTALLALAAPFVARADVTPNEPGPGDSFTAGQTCHIAWDGDSVSTTVWKNMAIELMSGSNGDMNHITTVATNQDGTVSGTFDYPCPEVNPYSAIYFYQFSSPQTSVKTWTTRFTIASPTGATTPPANAIQPGSNDPIPWGIGALVDPSKAVAAPVSGTGPVSGNTTGNTTGTTTGTTTGAPANTAATTTPTLTKVTTSPAAATNVVTPTKTSNSTAANSTTTGTKDSGAAALSLGSVHAWLSVTALVLAASAW